MLGGGQSIRLSAGRARGGDRKERARVDLQLEAGDVARGVRGQVQDGLADVGRVKGVDRELVHGAERRLGVFPGGCSRSGRKRRYMASFCSMSVSMLPGCTALTRMPCGASARARSWVKRATPRLAWE